MTRAKATAPGTLATRLQARMRELGLSWAALAKGLGMPKTTIQGYVQGTRTNPSDADLARVAAHVGLRPLWLRTGEGPRVGPVERTLSPLERKIVTLARAEALYARRLREVRRELRERRGEQTEALELAEPREAEGDGS